MVKEYQLVGKYRELKEILRVGNVIYFVSFLLNKCLRYYKGELNGCKVVRIQLIRGIEPLEKIIGLDLKL